MHIRGFHHLAIQVHDIEKVCVFYREVLGLTEQSRQLRPDGSVRSIWLRLAEGEDAFLALEVVSPQPSSTEFRHAAPGFHLLALRIGREDREALLNRMGAVGIAVYHQTRWTFYVRDPEGNRIGLSHHPTDPLPLRVP